MIFGDDIGIGDHRDRKRFDGRPITFVSYRCQDGKSLFHTILTERLLAATLKGCLDVD